MNNVIPLPRLLSQYGCGKCAGELFLLAIDEHGKLIAVCNNCQCPSTQIGCGCLGYQDADKKIN